MLTVFIDSNIILHRKPLQELDTMKVFGEKKILVVVCFAVLKEINKEKDTNRNSRVKDRARNFLKLIESSENNPIILSDSITITTFFPNPNFDFHKYYLDPNISDDLILSSIIQYMHLNVKDK